MFYPKDIQKHREREEQSFSVAENLLYKSKLTTGLSLLFNPIKKQSNELVKKFRYRMRKTFSLMKDLSHNHLVPEMASSPLQPQASRICA